MEESVWARERGTRDEYHVNLSIAILGKTNDNKEGVSGYAWLSLMSANPGFPYMVWEEGRGKDTDWLHVKFIDCTERERERGGGRKGGDILCKGIAYHWVS